MIGANLVLNPGETARVELRFVEPVKVTELRPGFVAWEPYHGASAYEVQIDCVSTEESGYSTIGAVMLRTDGHSLEFDEAPVIPFGVIAMDQHGVLPSHLTGMPDAYLIRVQAIDAQGKTISSSPGLRFEPGIDLSSLIRPDRVEPAEAESLLAERKYDEAVAALEDRLAQSPDDLRTLEILARVYFMGTYDCDPDPLSEDMAHRNLARSLSLLERLTELAPTPDNINALDTVRRALERESENTRPDLNLPSDPPQASPGPTPGTPQGRPPPSHQDPPSPGPTPCSHPLRNRMNHIESPVFHTNR